jgi:hypothetical protein
MYTRKNRVSYDYHGLVGSPSLNIAVVKETYIFKFSVL